MVIAILDNDVLVYLFEEIYLADRKKFGEIMDYLILRFNEIWIPKEVKREFFEIRKRRNRLGRLMKKHSMIKDCPITISKNEINLILSDQIDQGEADGIFQTRKIGDYRKYTSKKFLFVSNDRPALRGADTFGIDFLPYEKLRDEWRQMGVEV